MFETRMLLVAGYADVDLAEKEFRALAARVSAKERHSDVMILVGKNAHGSSKRMPRTVPVAIRTSASTR
jgi:hypothetical protein